MILSKFEVKFYQRLESFFQSNGFSLLMDQKQFRKSTQNGFQNIIFSVTETEKVFWIEVNFGVRYEFVEQIAQQFLNNARGYRPSANTLVISIGKFQELKYFRFKVTDELDFGRIVEEIILFFTKRGFDFLQKAETILFIEEILNDSPTMPCRYLYNQVHRCFKGAIAAKLTDNQNFTTIANIYRQFLLKNGTDEELINYERLITFLHHYNAN
ncbi:hypothetical protein EMA8858_00681 [Emticicia aquatica]|uniref:DUF4304 domain-containing protein n=2 Tax=Emticicia aquatica TaxID=1681835 RepID=A0ABN8ERW0_9BACT|nr:hypothetical protein EMA8858_00681 [Emticicia aquatica]